MAPEQLDITCLTCERTFWTRRAYHRHKATDCRTDCGESGTDRQRRTPADIAAGPALDPVEMQLDAEP